MERAEQPQETLVREIREEPSLEVEVSTSPIDTYVFDVFEPQGRFVFVPTSHANNLTRTDS